MKRSKIKYESILDIDLILANYRVITRNTKHKTKIVKYDIFNSTNVTKIYDILKNETYSHEKYNIFLVKDPKYRIVMSETIGDKIVNHLVSNVFLKPVIYPKLIDENVATRVGMGTNAAIKLCKKFFLHMNNKYDKFYILKFDIKKYFYSIDHEILKGYLDSIFEDKRIIKLLSKIIDSTDYDYINKEIDSLIYNEKRKISKKSGNSVFNRLKELDKIPYYRKGKGIGIGSLSNQIFAVFYLNGLDHFIKEKLGIKEYCRFMDDGIIFYNDLKRINEIKDEIGKYVKSLNLELNSKTKVYNSKDGFEFVGYRFFEKNGRMIIRIKNDTKKRMKKKFKCLNKYNLEKYVRVKASYKGLVQYSNVDSFVCKYFE